MSETDYFTVEINEEEIGVSESRTQYKKIYKLEVGDVKYRIESKVELEREYWYVYVDGHPQFEDGVVHKSSSITFGWKWVRDDISKQNSSQS
jgi:hypothetical protein